MSLRHAVKYGEFTWKFHVGTSNLEQQKAVKDDYFNLASDFAFLR